MANQIPGSTAFPPAVAGDWDRTATWAEVSLDAIMDNVRSLKAHAGTEAIAVVKANAYGHGATPVAQAALEAGATMLAVYTVEEAVVLRTNGITAPILVFGSFGPHEASEIFVRHLTPTLTSVEAAQTLQSSAGNRSISVHVKVDTGLERAGLSRDEALELVEGLHRFPALHLEGLYTHFARADEAGQPATAQQLDRLMTLASQLQRRGRAIPMLHASNSAGTLTTREAHLDAIRLGISMYGSLPAPTMQSPVPLRPALRLSSRITRVHRIPAGTGVGYGHEFIARRDSTVALVPIGYGDGLPRTLGNERGRVIVHGQLAPIIGRVSMDQITVDVTDIPKARVGDVVTVIGADGEAIQTADDLAEQAGTISYDILTGILPRVPRVYVKRGQVCGLMRLACGPQVIDLDCQ